MAHLLLEAPADPRGPPALSFSALLQCAAPVGHRPRPRPVRHHRIGRARDQVWLRAVVGRRGIRFCRDEGTRREPPASPFEAAGVEVYADTEQACTPETGRGLRPVTSHRVSQTDRQCEHNERRHTLRQCPRRGRSSPILLSHVAKGDAREEQTRRERARTARASARSRGLCPRLRPLLRSNQTGDNPRWLCSRAARHAKRPPMPPFARPNMPMSGRRVSRVEPHHRKRAETPDSPTAPAPGPGRDAVASGRDH